MRASSIVTLLALLVAAAPAFAQGGGAIVVDQPWAQATPTGAKTGAVYMTLTNKSGSADRLTGGSSDAAATVRIHQMSVVNGTMQMREVPGGLPVPAGGQVALKPGSYHVMLIGLKKPLMAGQTIPLTLTFEKAGNIPVTVPIKPIGDGTMGHGDHGGMGGMEMK